MIILVTLCALITLGFAQDITGAFGIKLGQRLDTLKVLEAIDNKHYVIDPPIKVSILSTYGVTVTPISKKVYQIMGMSDFMSESACEEWLHTLKNKLEDKYGIKFQKQLAMEPVYMALTGARGIDIRCTGSFTVDGMRYRLMLQYIDTTLAKEAKKESIELKSKEIDESGL